MLKKTGNTLRDLVQQLLANKQATKARTLVEQHLSELPAGSQRERAALLDILLGIETYSNRHNAALAALALRRPLGFRNTSEEFDAALLAALLLMKTQQWFSARTELTELLTNQKSGNWSGILEALAAYVDADEQCGKVMAGVLASRCRASIAKFDIPVQVPLRDRNAARSIKRAHRLFHAASKRYERLILKAFRLTTKGSRSALARQLKRRAEVEGVGYFRELAKGLLKQITRPSLASQRGTKRAEGKR
jgi:hypothetical protein